MERRRRSAGLWLALLLSRTWLSCEAQLLTPAPTGPSLAPSQSLLPSYTPTSTPFPSRSPTPSLSPSVTPQPSSTFAPSEDPSQPPTRFPTLLPTFSAMPSTSPPSLSPTTAPSDQPSNTPSTTVQPSVQPSVEPSAQPSLSSVPSSVPSLSLQPTTTLVPSGVPTLSPTQSAPPSSSPSTLAPTTSPSQPPSSAPSQAPTVPLMNSTVRELTVTLYNVLQDIDAVGPWERTTSQHIQTYWNDHLLFSPIYVGPVRTQALTQTRLAWDKEPLPAGPIDETILPLQVTYQQVIAYGFVDSNPLLPEDALFAAPFRFDPTTYTQELTRQLNNPNDILLGDVAFVEVRPPRASNARKERRILIAVVVVVTVALVAAGTFVYVLLQKEWAAAAVVVSVQDDEDDDLYSYEDVPLREDLEEPVLRPRLASEMTDPAPLEFGLDSSEQEPPITEIVPSEELDTESLDDDQTDEGGDDDEDETPHIFSMTGFQMQVQDLDDL